MKKLLIIFFTILVITACNKENNTYETIENNNETISETKNNNTKIEEIKEKEINYFYVSENGNGNKLFYHNDKLIYNSDGKLNFESSFYAKDGVYYVTQKDLKCLDTDCRNGEFYNSIYENGEKIIDSGKDFLIESIKGVENGNIYYTTIGGAPFYVDGEQSLYQNNNKLISLEKSNRLETINIKGNIFNIVYETQSTLDKKVKYFFKNGNEIKISNAENIKFDEDGNYYYQVIIGNEIITETEGIYKNGELLFEQPKLIDDYFIIDGENIFYLGKSNGKYEIFLNGKMMYNIDEKEDFMGVKNGNIFYKTKGNNGLFSLYKNNEKIVEDFNTIHFIGFTQSGEILFSGKKGFNGIKYKIYKNSSLIIDEVISPNNFKFNNIGNIIFTSWRSENQTSQDHYLLYKDGEIIQSLFKGNVLGISDNGDVYTKEEGLILKNGYLPNPKIKDFLKDENNQYIFNYYIGEDENGEAIFKGGEKISEYYKKIIGFSVENK
ncbi:MAG: hypothetical protein AB7E37_05925 [Candidatus Altimarinota bacterium]